LIFLRPQVSLKRRWFVQDYATWHP